MSEMRDFSATQDGDSAHERPLSLDTMMHRKLIPKPYAHLCNGREPDRTDEMEAPARPSSPPHIPPYIRIRQYVISEIARASGMARIKTEHELCRLFQVSRTTVRKALSELCSEGYLIRKPGLGTFVNPEKVRNSWSRPRRRMMGVVIGDGAWQYYNHSTWGILSELGLTVTGRSMLLRILALTHRLGDASEELLSLRLDGLAWIYPGAVHYETMLQLVHAGLPVVAVNPPFLDDSLASVAVDYRKTAYRMAAHLLALGHTRFACVFARHHLDRYTSQCLPGFRGACEAYGCLFDESRVVFTSNPYQDVRSLCSEPDFTALLSFAHHDAVLQAVTDAGIAIPQDCSVVLHTNEDPAGFGNVSFTKFMHPAGVLGRVAGEWLTAAVDTGEPSPLQKRLEPDLAAGESCRALDFQA